MNTQHTPGPWEVQLLEEGKNDYAGWNSYCIRDGKTNVHIASVGQVDRYFEPHHAANARLIAAAPELVAVVELMQQIIKTCRHCATSAEVFDHLGVLDLPILDVLQKVKGGAQ